MADGYHAGPFERPVTGSGAPDMPGLNEVSGRLTLVAQPWQGVIRVHSARDVAVAPDRQSVSRCGARSADRSVQHLFRLFFDNVADDAGDHDRDVFRHVGPAKRQFLYVYRYPGGHRQRHADELGRFIVSSGGTWDRSAERDEQLRDHELQPDRDRGHHTPDFGDGGSGQLLCPDLRRRQPDGALDVQHHDRASLRAGLTSSDFKRHREITFLGVETFF